MTLDSFTKIQLSFFILSHIHEDIDLRFSTILLSLKHQVILFFERIVEHHKREATKYGAFCYC